MNIDKIFIINLEKRIRCGKYTIGEYDDKIPSNLTAEEISELNARDEISAS